MIFTLQDRGRRLQAADTHTHCQQVRTECARALFRKAHGDLPATLDELVPGFLDRTPKDVMDGQPVRYRRSDTGGYLLWSVGANRIDDGARTDPKAKRHKSSDWVSELPL